MKTTTCSAKRSSNSRIIKAISTFMVAAMCCTTPLAVSANAASTLLYPVENGRTAYVYGYSSSYGSWHSGIDIHCNGNDTIYAAKSGTVIATANSCWHVNYGDYCEHYNTYGNYIVIRDSSGKTYYYGHLLKDSLNVSVGSYVNKGDPIARMGSSGYSNGKHLHFEVRNANNSTINVNENAISYSRSGYKSSNSNTSKPAASTPVTVTITPERLPYNIPMSSTLSRSTLENLIFDETVYAHHNPDVVRVYGKSRSALMSHWRKYGQKEGRTFGYIFQAEVYLNSHSDLKAAFGDGSTRESRYKALNHFITYGYKENRILSKVYSATYYRNSYSDLNKAFGNNWAKYLQHFVRYTIYGTEMRQASSEVSLTKYMQNYEDLRKAFGGNPRLYAAHLANYSAVEGRKTN